MIGGYTIVNDKWEVKDTILVYLIKNNLIESFPIFEIYLKFPRLCPLVCQMKKSTDNTCNLVKYIFIFGGNNPKNALQVNIKE